MQGSNQQAINSRVGKTLFLLVMFLLVVMIANRIHPGSARIAGGLVGFAFISAFLGGPLSMLLDRLFLAQLLGARNSLIASCMVIWLLVLAHLLTLRPDDVIGHGPASRVLGATIGIGLIFWFRHRRQERAKPSS